jgi:nucleoside-diphosphate-sugar epimerase
VTRTALVVGGTGPTGPHVVTGLAERGFDVTIFHRGAHELPELDPFEHVHGDPHFPETIAASLGEREFDVVLAMYGRVVHLSAAFAGRTGQFVSISGGNVYRGHTEPWRTRPYGLPIPVRESDPVVDEGDGGPLRFARLMVETEHAVLAQHERATIFRYPIIYGPRNLVPFEWSVIKRVLDGRTTLALPDGGLNVYTRCAAWNAAHCVLLAVEDPRAAGQVYNCGDDRQLSVRQWADLVLAALDADLEIVSVPSEVAPGLRAAYLPQAGTLSPHQLRDTSKVRAELGYGDVVDTAEAIRRTVEWYLANPVAEAGRGFYDRFDYELEDRLVAEWRGFVAELAQRLPQPEADVLHAMPHPKTPGVRDERDR